MDAQLDDRARRPKSHGGEFLRVEQLFERCDTFAGQGQHTRHARVVEGLPGAVVLRLERSVFRQPAADRALVDPAPLRGALDRLLRQQRLDRRFTDGIRLRAVTVGSGPFFTGVCGRLRVVFCHPLGEAAAAHAATT